MDSLQANDVLRGEESRVPVNMHTKKGG